MKQKITLKEIAADLDVSISTVSKALKNSKEIGEETRQKVIAYAQAHNYHASNIAISLKEKKTKNIALIIPEVVNNFFSKVIRGVEQEANNNGYNVIICLSNESFDKEVINIDTLANSGTVDGFIISLSKETQLKQDFNHLIEAENQGMPLVMFDRVTDKVLCDKVIIDDSRGAYNAVAYFIEKGRKKIALITTDDYISVGNLRTQGYINALKDFKIENTEGLILRLNEKEDNDKKIASFVKSNAIDAIFAVNEIFAVTAMKTLQNLGKKIPR
ncbi:MAG: LacI family DNA-binding transcriptional regulator, partial [Leeuwenhoekiella sp.]